MAQANFASILDKPSEGGKRPPPLPHGSYLAITQGLPRFDKSAKKQTEFVEFTFKLMQAMDDVDADALEESLTKMSGEKIKLTDRNIKGTYYLTEDAIWRLEKFLEHLGLDKEDFESRREMIDATPNKQVILHIKHTPSDDGETMYANINGTAAVE